MTTSTTQFFAENSSQSYGASPTSGIMRCYMPNDTVNASYLNPRQVARYWICLLLWQKLTVRLRKHVQCSLTSSHTLKHGKLKQYTYRQKALTSVYLLFVFKFLKSSCHFLYKHFNHLQFLRCICKCKQTQWNRKSPAVTVFISYKLDNSLWWVKIYSATFSSATKIAAEVTNFSTQ